MSFLIAPLEALCDPRLSDPERRVLLALYSFRNKNADTVWPSIQAIADRANVKDRTWISRLTKSLSEKGWLQKKKRGFTGGNEYVLTVPKEAEEHVSKLDCEATLDAESKMDQKTSSKLDCQATSKLDCEATYNEQQSEQQIEQQKKNPRLIHGHDFSSWPEMPDPEVVKDWLAVRKAKRAKTTPTAIKRFAKPLAELLQLGYSMDDVLSRCVTQGWTGLEVDWIHKSGQQAPAPRNREPVNAFQGEVYV